MTDKDKEKPAELNFRCQKSEAVFCTVLAEALKTDSTYNQFTDELDKAMEHVEDISGDRLLALIADMLVENAIDNYLSALMKGYKKELSDNRFFTFSLKIATARALRFSPPHLFIGADIIHHIRNEFAHKLEIKKFEDLKPKLKAEVDNALLAISNRPLNKPLPDKFRLLLQLTITPITMYSKQIRLLDSFLRDEGFMEWFAKTVILKDKDNAYEVTKKGIP